MTKHVKKFYRSRTDRIIAGVAGGIGEYFEIDPVVFRILFIILLFAGGFTFWLYIILILVVPSEIEGAVKGKKTGKEKAKKETKKAKEEAEQLSGKQIIALVIILMGLAILMTSLFPTYLGWFKWNVFWAIVILLIGFVILFKKQKD